MPAFPIDVGMKSKNDENASELFTIETHTFQFDHEKKHWKMPAPETDAMKAQLARECDWPDPGYSLVLCPGKTLVCLLCHAMAWYA